MFNLDYIRKKITDITDNSKNYSMDDFEKEFSKTDKTINNGEYFKISLNFKNESNNQDPEYATSGSSGFDLRANLTEPIVLRSGNRAIIPTGLFFNIPNNFEIQIRPRSGLAAKNGVTVLNTPGTIDCVPIGTKISTPIGDKLIEDIFNSNVIEPVLSYNEDTGKIEEDIVSDSWVVSDLELIEVITDEDDIIRIPLTKEVLTINGWKLASNLTTDDMILKLE